MSDDASADSVRSIQLEIDRARLEIEKISASHETHRLYLEGWHTDVDPVHESYIKSREFSNSFARLALNMLFLLNGGALVAVPTFKTIEWNTSSENFSLLPFFGVSSFILGLTLVALATYFAHECLQNDACAEERKSAVLKCKHNLTQTGSDEKRRQIEAEQKLASDKERSLRRESVRNARLSKRCWVFGLILFMVGCSCFLGSF